MKKRTKLLAGAFCLVVLVFETGCGSISAVYSETDKTTSMEEAGTIPLTEAATGSVPGEETWGNASADAGGKPAPEGEIDIDLTVLSSTMVYSEVYNMMTELEQYIGKTVKMKGLFAVYSDESMDSVYYACVIQDAAACCAQGIEFVLTEDYTYPEDYPGEGDEITVTGVSDTYMEGDLMYCTLREAGLEG